MQQATLCRRGGIDVAERLWREMLRDVRQTSDLEYKHARLRLEQVLPWPGIHPWGHTHELD